jgi:hypothetical protein
MDAAEILERSAGRGNAAALPQSKIPYGPWKGSWQSISAELVSREYAVAASGTAGVASVDFLYLPRSGTWKRRSGTTIQFDSFGSPVGLLPAKWSSKARQMDEFLSSSISDGVPTTVSLVSRETISSGLDDGRFSNVYIRDQANSTNYTLCSEFGDSTYPDPGSTQSYRVVPLWYDSGEGGLTRGVTEFDRRFLVSGSRRMQKVGNWRYFPSFHGTPIRWNEEIAGGLTQSFLASSDITTFGTEWGTNGAATQWQAIQTPNDSTSYAHRHGDVGSYNFDLGLNGSLDTSINSWTISYRARYEGTAPTAGATIAFSLTRNETSGTPKKASANIDATALTTSWTDYTTTITFPGTASSVAANSLRLQATVLIFFDGYIEITYVSVAPSGTAASNGVNRIIPSGPLPPTHAGTLSVGAIVGGDTETVRPDSDVTDGAFTKSTGGNTDMYQMIDEVTADDSDYITTADGVDTTCEFGLGNPTNTPAAGDGVVVRYRYAFADTGGSSSIITLSVALYEGATQRAGTLYLTGFAPSSFLFTDGYFTLTDAEIGSITDWTNLRIRFGVNNVSTSDKRAGISYAALEHTRAVVEAEGVWRGRDRFLYSVAYRFEDGSVWAPCTPRLPNDILPSGFNMFTLNAAVPNTAYASVLWSNIPIGPHGTKSRLLLRSPKVAADSETQSLDLNPFDLRVIWEIEDNSTTSYTDSFANDYSLQPDEAGAFVRFDHIMPPRSRYIFGGDMRLCHAYGSQNPCAIILAPTGFTTTMDGNLPDTSATAYDSTAQYFFITSQSGANGLWLQGSSGGSSFIDFATYNTLQKLVDRINTSLVSDNGKEWRAQLAPEANPDASCVNTLTPHFRRISANAVTSGQPTIINTAGGLSDVPVGARVDSTPTRFAAGAYVLRIDSDTQLTMSSNATGSSDPLTVDFMSNTGDDSVGIAYAQRAIANSLPGFIYFNKTYLDAIPTQKSTVWMTTASPGSNKSAANCFSGKEANRFTPPGNPGISMGGAGVENGFVLPFGNSVYVVKNTRDTGSGVDEEYRLEALNESRGCCAWNTVAAGNRFAAYLTPEGVCAADLDREILLSEAVFLHYPATGALAYEIPKCIAATASDNDTAYASMRIMRSQLWLSYRSALAPTRPDRQLVYDFSSGHESSGLKGLMRDSTSPWGWSVPLVRAVTAMVEARRSDGSHLYGWNEANAGSTGDGRIDELEISDTDNGTAIAASLVLPWERMGRRQKLSAQEFTIEHTAPAGATTFLDFYRGFGATSASAVTLSTSALIVGREVKLLPQVARNATESFYLVYRQTGGGASELRAIELRAKALPSYT